MKTEFPTLPSSKKKMAELIGGNPRHKSTTACAASPRGRARTLLFAAKHAIYGAVQKRLAQESLQRCEKNPEKSSQRQKKCMSHAGKVHSFDYSPSKWKAGRKLPHANLQTERG